MIAVNRPRAWSSPAVIAISMPKLRESWTRTTRSSVAAHSSISSASDPSSRRRRGRPHVPHRCSARLGREPSSKLGSPSSSLKTGSTRDERVSADRPASAPRPPGRRGRGGSVPWYCPRGPIEVHAPRRQPRHSGARPVRRRGRAGRRANGRHRRHALEPARGARPRAICGERRKEPEPLESERREPGRLHRREDRARPHVEDALVPLPAHPGSNDQLDVVEHVERVRLEEDDPAAGPDEARHRRERCAKVVEVVEREEPDHGVERPVEPLRKVEDVPAGGAESRGPPLLNSRNRSSSVRERSIPSTTSPRSASGERVATHPHPTSSTRSPSAQPAKRTSASTCRST